MTRGTRGLVLNKNESGDGPFVGEKKTVGTKTFGMSDEGHTSRTVLIRETGDPMVP